MLAQLKAAFDPKKLAAFKANVKRAIAGAEVRYATPSSAPTSRT